MIETSLILLCSLIAVLALLVGLWSLVPRNTRETTGEAAELTDMLRQPSDTCMPGPIPIGVFGIKRLEKVTSPTQRAASSSQSTSKGRKMSDDDEHYKVCFDEDHYDLAFQIALYAMATATERGDMGEVERWKEKSLECLEFAELTIQEGVKH